jgi:hypothetical protein
VSLTKLKGRDCKITAYFYGIGGIGEMTTSEVIKDFSLAEILGLRIISNHIAIMINEAMIIFFIVLQKVTKR